MKRGGPKVDDSGYEKNLAKIHAAGLEYKRKSERAAAEREDANPMILSPLFSEALVFAAMLHRGQHRKGTAVPYISHPLAVAALVLENGGAEEEAIAALLHDCAEDCGGAPTLDRIRIQFGDAVADIVADCTDTMEQPKPDWLTRKQAYLSQIPHESESSRLVSLADKVHNAGTILADLQSEGDSVWNRFRRGKAGTLWYYRALAEAFTGTGPASLASQLDSIVTAIEREFNDGGSVTDTDLIVK